MQTEPQGGGTVLIIEDEGTRRELLIQILTADGYAVVGAASGIEALDRLREGPRPALVLLDLRMPVMDGTEFLKKIEQDPALAAVPVILMSEPGEAIGDAASGAVGCLSKPIDPQTLCGVARFYCRPPAGSSPSPGE